MKDDQGELFPIDGAAYARGSDPDTSHGAADSVRGNIATVLEYKVLRVLREHPLGLTNHEIVALTGLTWNTATPRIAPLVRKGLVYDTGRRRKGPTNRACIVWAAVPMDSIGSIIHGPVPVSSLKMAV